MQRESQLSRIIPVAGTLAALLSVAFLSFALLKVNHTEQALNENRKLLQEQGNAASAILEITALESSKDGYSAELEAWRLRGLLRVSELSILFARQPTRFGQVSDVAAVIDLGRGRIIHKSQRFRTTDFTDAVRTTLVATANRSTDSAFWMEGKEFGWAVSPAVSKNYRTLLRIPLSEKKGMVSSQEVSKAKTQAALVSLAEGVSAKSSKAAPSSQLALLMLLAIIFFGFSLAVFIKIRFDGPLSMTAQSMSQWLSGEKGTVVNDEVGASSVKRVSKAVNQMIEQVDVRRQGRLRGIADGAFALATSLRMVAQGDLKLIPPTVPDELSPIAIASEEMITALNTAVQGLYTHAIQAVNHLKKVNYGTIQILLALRSQLETLEKLAQESSSHTANVSEYPSALMQSLKHFEETLAQCNASAQRIRMGVAVIARKSAGIGELAQRLKSGLVEAVALDESLELLRILSDESASVAERESAIARSATTLRTAQTALDQIKQLGAAVHRDVEDVRRGLGGLSLEQLPDMSTHFDEPSKIFTDVMSEFSLSVQGINEILNVMSKNSEQIGKGLGQITESLEERDELAQRLDTALSRFDLDGRLDAELIARLETARDQYRELEVGELSEEAMKMTTEIQESASQVRQKLDEMLDAVEATADAIRNSST